MIDELTVKVEKLKKQSGNLASLVMKYEEAAVTLEKEKGILISNKERLEEEIILLAEKLKKDKADFLSYKQLELDNIGVKRSQLNIVKSEIEEKTAINEKRIKELKSLEVKRVQEREQLVKDKKEIETSEEENSITKQDNEKKEKELDTGLKELQEKRTILEDERQQVAIALKELEVKEGKKQQEIESLENEKESYKLMTIGLKTAKEEIEQINGEISKIKKDLLEKDKDAKGALDDLKKQLSEVKESKEIYEKKFKNLKAYENDLKLKRLQLIKRAKDKDIKLQIEELT